MRTTLILLLMLLTTMNPGHTQTLTNLGTDFWIAFPPNNTASAQLKVFISSDIATSGTVSSAFPGTNQNFTVVPGIVTELTVPSGIALSGGIEDKGIHITSAAPIAVYGLNWQNATTDAYMALPVPSLGTEYRILTYETTLSNNGSCFSVVATQNGTSLNIYNHQTNGTSVINLNQGQTYHLEAINLHEDLTGSTVQSNVPVAVFVSVDLTNVPFSCQFADHIVEQLWPLNSWGKDFVTVPTAGRDNSGDVFRIVASEDNTDVTINGSAVATLNAGDYYESILTGYNVISATKPSCLAQFAKGTTCSGGTTGDPFMMLIPPREQFLTGYTVTTVAGFTSHWVNLVVPDYGLGTVVLDGVPIPAGMFTQIGTSSFYGAQQPVSEGTHVFTSTVPFGAFVYGWTNVNSYGYPGGGSMSPVATVTNVSIAPDTLDGILNVSNLCFTAFVSDQYGDPVVGVLVTFYVEGLNPLTGNAYTDASGQAQYCYTQVGMLSCTDYIYAEVTGFTSDSSVANWVYIPPCTNPVDGGTIGNAQSGCGGYTPVAFTEIAPPSGYSGTLEYLWQFSVTGPLAGFMDIASSNSATLTPGFISQTTWYRRMVRVDCMPDWTGAANSNVIEATVITRHPFHIDIASPSPSCPGTLVTFTAATLNGGPTPSYQWQVNGVNAGANNPVYAYIPSPGDSVRCILTSSLPCVTINPVSGIWYLVSFILLRLFPLSLVSIPSPPPTRDPLNSKEAFHMAGSIQVPEFQQIFSIRQLQDRDKDHHVHIHKCRTLQRFSNSTDYQLSIIHFQLRHHPDRSPRWKNLPDRADRNPMLDGRGSRLRKPDLSIDSSTG